MMSSSSSIAVKTAFAAAQRGMAKNEKVERPTTKSEYELQFASVQAKGGWTDLKATTRNAFVVNWDSLTHLQVTTPGQLPAAWWGLRPHCARAFV